MDDGQIIELYHRRDEQAIAESERKYGRICRCIAQNILSIKEDAEECVNDTWYAAWKRMPPDKPQILGAFFGRITRNLSISRWRAYHAMALKSCCQNWMSAYRIKMMWKRPSAGMNWRSCLMAGWRHSRRKTARCSSAGTGMDMP